MSSLALIAEALGGHVDRGHGCVRAPGPGHSRIDRSLTVWIDREDADGFRVESFAGDPWQACRDHVRARLRLPDRPPVRRLEPVPEPEAVLLTDLERTRRAVAMWEAARDPRGTVVESYLRSRGLELPGEAAGGAIRFHPACPFAGRRMPVMIALVRDVRTDEPQAVHRTALAPDGRKMVVQGHDRLAYGPTAGGAVKLTPNEKVTTCLGVGEGIESTLSLRHIPEYGASPVWALISAGGVRTFPVLSGIECLWLAVDHDDAGRQAAQTCGDRWTGAGLEVLRVTTRLRRTDLNDVVRGAHG